nr:MAG TPA: hypothetical protein [Caudoviricetes sp.]
MSWPARIHEEFLIQRKVLEVLQLLPPKRDR